MRRVISQMVVAAAVLSLTAVGSLAQQTTSTAQTKAFQVLAVEGNVLVVSLPEGTRELTGCPRTSASTSTASSCPVAS